MIFTLIICLFVFITPILSDKHDIAESLSSTLLQRYPELNSISQNLNTTKIEDQLINLIHIISTKEKSNVNSITNCSLNEDLCEKISQNECLLPKDLLGLLPESPKSLASALAILAPGILLQGCASPVHPVSPFGIHPSPIEVWGYGMLFVTLVSVSSLVGVLTLPLLKKQLYRAVMDICQGLAVGSLSGSAAFHLIPQAFNLTEADDLWKCLIIFCGIYMFFVSERVMKICVTSSNQRVEEASAPTLLDSTVINHDEAALKPATNGHIHRHHSHQGLDFSPGQDSAIKTVAWMVILGDGLHNLIDGLSMGAAFSQSIVGGVSVSVAVLAEELPHELGDFAVLLGAGMMPRQALLYNLLSACTCYFGLVLGILIGTAGSNHVLALAAGVFLYIALVDMMGELNEALDITQEKRGHTLHLFLLQNVGILTGAISLFLLARYNHLISFG